MNERTVTSDVFEINLDDRDRHLGFTRPAACSCTTYETCDACIDAGIFDATTDDDLDRHARDSDPLRSSSRVAGTGGA